MSEQYFHDISVSGYLHQMVFLHQTSVVLLTHSSRMGHDTPIQQRFYISL